MKRSVHVQVENVINLTKKLDKPYIVLMNRNILRDQLSYFIQVTRFVSN